jgi:two-component system KDP operon response regulator KdpE
MHHTNILIVDDEPATLKLLRANLKTDGYNTLSAIDGAEALTVIEEKMPDLVVLDIMMPKVDGFEVLQRVREWSQLPIIVLSARGDSEDKIKCLDMGADDYISKPFNVNELLARVRTVLRRVEAIGNTNSTVPSISSGELEVNFAQRKVTISGAEIKLTPTEFRLLEELMVNAEKVLTHTHLLNKVWGPEYRGEREYLHTFVRRLRAKIEPEPTNPRYIITVPAIGYQFKNI